MTKINRAFLSLQLLLSSSVLTLRTRRGFTVLIGVIRLLGSIGIGFSFFSSGDFKVSQIEMRLFIYLLISLVSLITSIVNYKMFEKPIVQYGLIGTDFFFIIFFLLQRQDIHSEIYILLLLPLVVSAHFLPRWIAVAITFIIIATYGTTFYVAQGLEKSTIYQFAFIWLFRSLFLSLSTWLYRIQRNIPSISGTQITSPSKARERLENQLEQLKKVIDFDTASIQLLYKDRLLIVACIGFTTKNDIYSIEFPTDNPKYPNTLVFYTKSYVIVDSDNFPSFRDFIYHAKHIKTWMGIPLVSPSSGELIGILSIDSSKKNAYTKKDAMIATRAAMSAVGFLMETTLGPAALTMLTMRESVKSSIRTWSYDLAQKAVNCKDDLEAAVQIVKFGKQIFKTEDCSLYLLRPKYKKDKSKPLSVLHLVASSSVPPSQFSLHESIVSNQPGCGLTGYAVYKNNTLNLSSVEIENSPHHGSFTDNLAYLESKRSKQVMIVPIRNFRREPVGALKIENKIGWPSDNRFVPYEQYLFETFTHTIGALIEGIRQRNYINRQRADFHHLRAMISDAILKPLDVLLKKHITKKSPASKEYEWFRQGIGYVASEIDNMLLDPGESLVLESGGLIPALLDFVSLLSSGFPHFRDASERVIYQPPGARDDLPYLVRDTFYDIGREALLNAIRHSKVELSDEGIIEMFFIKSNNSYELMIRDNGIGFQVDRIEKIKTSYGLKEMRKEIQNIKRIGKYADLEINSSPHEGTSVRIIWTP